MFRDRLRWILGSLCAGAFMLSSQAPVGAQPPALEGVWSGIVTAPDSEEWQVEDLTCFAGCPKETLAYYIALLDDPSNADRPYGEVRAEIGRKFAEHSHNEFTRRLTPEGRRLRAEFPPSADPVLRCVPLGLIKQITSPLPVRITQEEDYVLMDYEQWGAARTIHMDGREHPASLVNTRMGHSTGRYEGSAFVIETVGIEPGVFWPHLTGGGAHSDQLRLVERYTRSEDGSWLNLEFTADDPAIFAEPYTVLRRWLATPDEIIAEEEECIGVAGQP